MINDTFQTATAQQTAPTMPIRPLRTRALVASASAFRVLADRTGDRTPVCGYRNSTDVVIKGAFPGTSAWSPPI